MRKLIATICITLMIVLASSPAFPYFVGSTDVGGLDSLLTWTDTLGNSNAQGEIDWVNAYLTNELGASAPHYTLANLTNYSVGAGDWDEIQILGTNDYHQGIWAIDFKTTPEYFYIKTGNLATGEEVDIHHYLYRNESELAWGVINLLALGVNVDNIGKISNVGELDTKKVPEPGTILLLGLGLLGTVAARRFGK